MKNLSLLLPMGVFFFSTITANAEVYKTINADGSVSYSDSPSINSSKVNVFPSAVGSTSKQTTTSKSSPVSTTVDGELNMPSASDVKPVQSPQPTKTSGGNQSKAASASGSAASAGGASSRGGGGSATSSGAAKTAAATTTAATTTAATTTAATTTAATTAAATTAAATTAAATTTAATTTAATTAAANDLQSIPSVGLSKTARILDKIQKDMVSLNEGIPSGSDKYAWSIKPVPGMLLNPTASGIPSWYPGTRFAIWDRVLGWMTAYKEKGAADPVNTRLALKDFYLYYFSKSKKQWVLLEHLPNIPENFRGEARLEANNQLMGFDVRNEIDGSKSYKMSPNSWFHTYGYLQKIDLSDYAGIYFRFDFKLVTDKISAENTLNSDKWVVQSGADYYPVEYPQQNLGASYNPGVGTGRFLRALPTWRTSSFMLLSAEFDFNKYPPNIDNFYE